MRAGPSTTTLRGDVRPEQRPAAGCSTATRRSAFRAEQRRAAVMAIVVSAWVLGAALIGTPEALGYLTPPLALLALLALGRYPGATAFERRLSARRARSAPRRARHAHQRRPPRRLLPRGGALLATGLAGRAPPVVG